MSDALVSNHVIHGEDIAPVIADIEDAIVGYDRNHIILALMCMIFIISDPTLDQDQLAEYVKTLSRQVVLMLGVSDGESVN